MTPIAAPQASRRTEPAAAVRARSRAAARLLGAMSAAWLVSPGARADEGFGGWSGSLQLLLRGVYLDPQNHSASQSPQLHLAGGFYGELAAAWFMTPAVSMELSLAEVSSFSSKIEEGQLALNNGALRLMPNTWTLQYNFAPSAALRPYLGAGLHYTTLAVSAAPGNTMSAVDASALGWVLQAGADLRLGGGWFVNGDLRYLGHLEPHMSFDDNSVRFTGFINPLLVGLGIGFRW
jgi:outer membrane protein